MTAGDPEEPTAPASPGAGEPIQRYGRFEVIRQIGDGGMGIVLEAHDPALDRKVALKLLKPRRNHSEAESARRLASEAQAMARLAHPNVVTVFEIDRVGDQVYVAMELVNGTTLRGWLRDRPRRWREIVEMFVAAGRGLAAAHAAGMVHRDFKPDNVLIGHDGRPRVCDFGLVVETSDDVGDDLVALAELDSHATLRGSAIGTPAYMSAEQWTGQPVNARTDQFAFCVALWEALCGCRPFAGTRPHEVRAAICAGAIAEPPHGRRAPRWLVAMVRRGLAVDPQARWPDLAALLDAIARRTRTGRRNAIAAVALAIALASAVAAAAVASRAPTPCAPPAERLAAVWSPARGDTLRARLVAIDPQLGAIRFAKAAAALDAGARAWSDMHVAACRATRIEGRQSDTLLDLRMACLDRGYAELADTIAVIAQADTPAAIDHATHAATSISSLDTCADTHALAAAPPPATTADRATAIALADRARELDVARRASRFDGLADRAADLVGAARRLAHAPTLAAALTLQINILNAAGNDAITEPIARELVDVAARAHDDRREAEAWISLIKTIATTDGKPDEATALFASAHAAVLRAGDPPDLRSELRYAQAIVLDLGRRPADGLALLIEARHTLEAAGATSPSSPLASLLTDTLLETATSQMRAGDNAAAIVTLRQTIERWRSVLGVDSVDEAFSWHNLSAVLQATGALDDALAAARQAVRIRAARLGDSHHLALSLVQEAGVLDDQGHWDQSTELYDRALQISRAQLAAGDLQLANPLIGRALAEVHTRHDDAAARDYDEAIALFERTKTTTTNLAIAVYNRGDLAARRDRCADAIRDFERAAALFDDLASPTSHLQLYPLAGKGACLVRLGRPAAAIPILERALARKTSGGDAFEVARAQAYLGRARVDTGRDRAAALALARAARAGLAASPDGADELLRLDRWLAAHPR